MLFQDMDDEQEGRPSTYGSSRRRPSEMAMGPINASKKELAAKLTEKTMGSVHKPKRAPLAQDTSFDQLLRE